MNSTPESVVLRSGDFSVRIAVDTRHLETTYGPRFDRTGVVISARRGTTEFLDPRGLCDEFGLHGQGVLGYADASPEGGEFLKIGVGVLQRDHPGAYTFVRHWPVAQSFAVSAKMNAAELHLAQTSAARNGYAYSLAKTYRVSADGQLSIACTLINCGETPFGFDHYNHNFFSFGGLASDGRYWVQPGFPLPADSNEHWSVAGGELRLRAPAPLERGFHIGFDFTPPALPNHVLLAHEGGSRVEIGGDFAVARFAVWAAQPVLCPEIFYRSALLAPRKSAGWARQYRFMSGQ